MKKLLFVLCLLFAFPVSASTVSDGAIVKTDSSPDVYIIKYNAGKQYKRLVLNPLVFKSYGHLKWDNIQTISQADMDSFAISDLVKVDGTTDIYQLVPEGDNGGRYLLTSLQGYDTNSIYIINSTDFNNYVSRGNRGAKEIKEQIQSEEVSDADQHKALEEVIKADTEKRVEEALKAKEEAEIQARKDKANSALDILNPKLEDVTTEYNTLSTKLETYYSRIEYLQNIISNTAGYSHMLAAEERNELSKKYSSDIKRYNELKTEKEKLEGVISRINRYSSNGTPITSDDEAYLDSLGISI